MRPLDASPSPLVEADLCDTDRVSELVADADTVIHMGAIPGTRGGEPFEIYHNNGQSTFSIMMAASQRSLRRVVFSSSAFAVGWAPNPSWFIPKYLPLDEDHPLMPFEPYGMSKQIGECFGEMIARSSDTSVVSLRFTNVQDADGQSKFPLPAPTRENPRTLVLWSYANPDVVAQAHVRSLDLEMDGHEAFLLAQPDTRFSESTVDLIKANFGDQVEIRGKLEGNASVICTKKARDVLGVEFGEGWSGRS